jgi:hypothetical protein
MKSAVAKVMAGMTVASEHTDAVDQRNRQRLIARPERMHVLLSFASILPECSCRSLLAFGSTALDFLGERA